MLNKDQLLQLGYEINPDPDQPGMYYWKRKNDTEGSDISFGSEAVAVLSANLNATIGGDLHVCDNCGKIHTDEMLLVAKDLGQRVAPGGVYPSGECSDCGALCYPDEALPDWDGVMAYFGLDTSFMYTDKDIAEFTFQYIESVAAEEKKARIGEMAIELLEEADSWLREIRAENLDGSEPAFGELLDRLTGFWIEVGDIKATPVADSDADYTVAVEEKAGGAVQVSLDGGVTYQNASNGVRLVYKDMPISDGYEAGELHVNATHEGLILDVLATRVGMVLDENIGTSSQMAADIVARMVEAND